MVVADRIGQKAAKYLPTIKSEFAFPVIDSAKLVREFNLAAIYKGAGECVNNFF